MNRMNIVKVCTSLQLFKSLISYTEKKNRSNSYGFSSSSLSYFLFFPSNSEDSPGQEDRNSTFDIFFRLFRHIFSSIVQIKKYLPEKGFSIPFFFRDFSKKKKCSYLWAKYELNSPD